MTSNSEQPPKEYIITEYELSVFETLAHEFGKTIREKQLGYVKAIRSRPSPAPAERLGFTEFCHVHCDKHECCTNECERSAYEAARQARENFVEQIEDKLPRYPSDLGDMYLLSDIQSLRTTTQHSEETTADFRGRNWKKHSEQLQPGNIREPFQEP